MFQWLKNLWKEDDWWTQATANRDLTSDQRFLFLDFDGVFMSTRNDPKKCMKWIMRLVNEEDLKIVISSSWRANPPMALSTLERMGCTAEVVGMTEYEGKRYVEIIHYLQKHPCQWFLILDDMDMGPLNQAAVRTTFSEGFTEQKYLEAKQKIKQVWYQGH